MIRKGALVKTGIMAAFTLAPVVASAHYWGAPQSGFYIGAGGGGARNRNLSSSIPGPFVNFKRTQPAWKAFIGYAFNRFFAIQGGYQNLGTDSIGTPVGSEKIRNRGYDVNGLLSFPFTPVFSLFIEGGGSRFRTRTVTPVSTTLTYDGTHPDYGAGVQINLARHLALRGQWQQFLIPHNDTQFYSGSLLFRF